MDTMDDEFASEQFGADSVDGVYKQVPADLVQELDMLMEKQTEILCGELKENFAEGFRAGVKLIKEVYLEEIPDMEEKIRNMV